ncbi:hypothetical protein [Sphingomonas sp. IW22]|uniref:hypothetical protein n=1 Tax=Sphingomonas sp. IW22 TaxID=3242489 RepID=UPI00352267CC
MAMHPRYDLRPRQRSRNGVKALDLAARPTRDDMMIDLIRMRVTGWISATSRDAVHDLFRRYRAALTSREDQNRAWSAISDKPSEYYRTTFRPGANWLMNETFLDARQDADRVKVSLSISINPTRILHHPLVALPDQMAREELLAMVPQAFFAAAAIEQGDMALGGADNAVPRPIEAQEKLGPAFADAFIEIVEVQLRRWVLDAIGPVSAGFVHWQEETRLIARSEAMALRLDWANLIVLYAEANFERRHSSAEALMERLAHTVPQAHSETGLRRYGETELGGRRLGSAVVGFARTKTVHQIYYAKYRDRVRAETRYLSAVRNAVRATRCKTEHPLADLLGQVRDDAVRRAGSRWAVFCAMCEEPRRATLHEVAGMVSLVADCAQAAGVAFMPVFSALLTSGGIDETGENGPAPRRLMDRLERAGLISRQNLNIRLRAGEQRRHALTGDWLEIVQRMKAAFDEPDPQTNDA